MWSLISGVLISVVLLSPPCPAAGDAQHQLNTVEDVLSEPNGGLVESSAAAGTSNSEALLASSTYFNGVEVPPMKELNGTDFDKETKDGYWYAVDTALSRHKSFICGTGRFMLLITVPLGLSSTTRHFATTASP